MINVTLDLRPIIVGTSSILGTAKGFTSDEFLKDLRYTVERELEIGFGESADKAAKSGMIPHVYRPRDMDDHFNLISSGNRSDRLWAIARRKASNSRGLSQSNFEIVFIKNSIEQPINPRIIQGILSDTKRFPKGNTLSRHIFPDTAYYLEFAKDFRARVGSPSKNRLSAGAPKRVVGLEAGQPMFMQNYIRANQYQGKFNRFASSYYNQQFAKGSPIMRSFVPPARMVARIIASDETGFRVPGPIPSIRPGFQIVSGSGPFYFRPIQKVVKSSESKMSERMLKIVKKAAQNSARRVII